MKRNVNIPNVAPDVSIVNKRVIKRTFKRPLSNPPVEDMALYNEGDAFGQNGNLARSSRGQHSYSAGRNALGVQYQPANSGSKGVHVPNNMGLYDNAHSGVHNSSPAPEIGRAHV